MEVILICLAVVTVVQERVGRRDGENGIVGALRAAVEQAEAR